MQCTLFHVCCVACEPLRTWLNPHVACGHGSFRVTWPLLQGCWS